MSSQEDEHFSSSGSIRLSLCTEFTANRVADPQRVATLVFREIPSNAESTDLDRTAAGGRHDDSMRVLETDRLFLRRLSAADAEFIVDLLNQPSFLRYIGDRGVRTVEDARQFIREGPIASYERFGFGLYRVELQGSAAPVGICGLLKREGLEDVDIGFAFLPQYWSQGYAFEAASAVMDYGLSVLGLERIVAIASPDNDRSFRLLEKLGLRFERMIQLAENEPPIKLFTASGDSSMESS